MKKTFILMLALVLITTSLVLVSAEENIKVVLDGNKIPFDVSPVLINGRTMVPVRVIFEKLGAVVEWDEKNNAVNASLNDKLVTLIVGSKTMYVNGNEVVLDVPATETNGRTLVPLRAISEAYGSEVGWDKTLNTVSIIKDKENFKMLYAYGGRMKAFSNSEAEYQLTQGWYSAPLTDVSKNIAQISDFIKKGMYLEAISECENLRDYNMTNEDSATINSLKSEAERKYQEYLYTPKPEPAPLQSYSGVYRTPSGKRYHFDPQCGGKNSYATTLKGAKQAGLTPCKKCAQ